MSSFADGPATLMSHHVSMKRRALALTASVLRFRCASPTINPLVRQEEARTMLNGNAHTDSSSRDYLLKLWSHQLQHPTIGVQDDFFEAGGSSMQFIEMLISVSTHFGKEIDYAEFFQEPCVRKLSELLER